MLLPTSIGLVLNRNVELILTLYSVIEAERLWCGDEVSAAWLWFRDLDEVEVCMPVLCRGVEI